MASNSICALSTDCASRLRQSQIITRVSDVVRELVDNGIDANAKGIQVFLENFGVKKVEVKDSGYGISEEDILKIFRGGYTSKLDDEKHLSCGQHYGFRGEALSSICSFSGVSITTKQENESAGRKYVLDKKGQIVSQHVVPVGTGTSVSVQELFKDFPVRQKYAMDVKNARNELKLIESYLKTVAIANPQLYICLYHNSNVIWTKPAAKNTEQTLVTVMGVNISRLLTKSQVLEFQSENTDASWKGTIELFVPKPPADMKNLGFTNNKMTMVFVNRRRVFMSEFEQIIKRYALASANCPTQAEQRKFPASVLLINLPPSEVDFNRETDKSKVFLNCKDHLLHLVEKMLQSIYGLILNIENTPDFDCDVVPGPLIENQSSLSTSLDTSQEAEASPPVAQEKKTSANRPLISTPVSTPEKRQENVLTFLGGIFPSSVTAKAPQHGSCNDVEKSSQIPLLKPEEQLRNKPTSFGANILKDQNRMDSDEDLAIAHPKEAENIMRRVGILENPEVPPEIGSTVDIFQTPAGSESRPSAPRETPNETSCDVSANSLLRVARSFELDEIPSNVVIHNIGSDDFTTSNRSSMQTLDPPLKRQKFMQPGQIFEAPKKGIVSDRSNQLKLGELAGWHQWQNNTTSSVGNNTSFVSKNLFSDLGSPRATEYITGSNAISKSNYNKPPAVFKYKNAEGLLGISTCISSTYIKERYAPFRSKDPSSYDATVIHQLEGTNVFMVKVDGLLGIFHAERFVATCPTLKDPYNSSFSSSEYVMKLLIHFTKVWESMKTDLATSIFHVLSDLHELDEKYMFENRYPFAIKLA